MKIAWVTCAELPEPDVDEVLGLAAFQRAGHEIEPVAWDRAADWSVFECAVIRSTWNYPWAEAEFRAWVDQVDAATRLLNPAEAVLWNLDKTYLFELEARGIPIVPTQMTIDAAWKRFVVKPTVSAGSWKTRVFRQEERAEAEAFAKELEPTHRAMFQPFMESVETGGERSLIWIGGEFTHAIRKNPRFDGQDESVSAAYRPSREERQFAKRVISAAPDDLVYARVDVMRDADGELCLSELELIEPSLFLKQFPAALEQLVEAVTSA